MRFARLTATLATFIVLFGILAIVFNHNSSSVIVTRAVATPTNVDLHKAFNWKQEAKKEQALAEARRLQEEAAAAKAAAEKAALEKAVAERAAQAIKATRTRSPRAVVQGTDNGDFPSCVRQKESTNNYAYNDGHYKGAYNMEDQHWSGYGGYPSADKAPPDVQDRKFREDMAGGRDYMHQQYPNTSRACGMG